MNGGYKAKICGTTGPEDARMAADAGADFFGVVVEVDFSPRSLSVDDARTLFANPPIPRRCPRIQNGGRTGRDGHPGIASLCGPIPGPGRHPVFETPEKRPSVGRTVAVPSTCPQAGETADFDHFRRTVKNYLDAGVDALLFDTVAVMQGKTKFGGTGRTSDWRVVKKLMDAVESPVPVWLAGGIHPGNVADALDAVDPYGIDLCSGVEACPGKKDPAKVTALMSAIREKSRNHK